jgi:UDP-glucuronate 4-epimerase
MIVVTGAAGFIGFHVSRRLLECGERVLGIDNFDHSYDPALKATRAATLERQVGFTFVRLDLADAPAVAALFHRIAPRRVVHLAARAGVRNSLDDPLAYERSNVAGHLAVLAACRGLAPFDHLVYASSSSVYGERAPDRPFREDDPVDAPVSLYAATKRAAELVSGTYAHLCALPQTGLRLFTAYGPWGRPDMAYFSFTRRILAGEPIAVFGDGQMARDFTYVDDVVEAVLAVLDLPPQGQCHRLLNVGSGHPIPLLAMIETLEAALGRRAEKVFLPRQPGEVTTTYADVSALAALTGSRPRVSLQDGIARFVAWYRDHYGAD